MLRLGLRRLHFGRRSPAQPAKGKPPAVPREIVLAAQTLRHSINAPDAKAVVKPLMDLNDAVSVHRTASIDAVPASVFSLINRTLERHTNYKGELSGDQLQRLFLTASTHNAVEPATKLYMDVHRHSKISKQGRLNNGRIFFAMLRRNGHALEANQQVTALLRDNAQVVDDGVLLEFLNVISETASPVNTGPAILAVIRASQLALPEGPSSEVLIKAVDLMAQWAGPGALNELADHIYYVNPHFRVDDAVAVVFLDAFLQVPPEALTSGQPSLPDAVGGGIPVATAPPTDSALEGAFSSSSGNAHSSARAADSMQGGARILKLLLARLDSPASSSPSVLPSLEICELLLMSVINFQEPPSVGRSIQQRMSAFNESEYTKETWDVLAQWAAYSDPDLSTLFDLIDNKMPSEYSDAKTLELVLLAASEKAQRSEQQIAAITTHFETESDVVPDASVYEILMRRALRSTEVDRAREIFANSNTDWNINANKHTAILSELLVALSRTTSVTPQQVLDTYQRVRLFVPRVSYKAQVALLQMLLHEAQNGSATPAGVFLIEQFGETPMLPFAGHQEIFYLFYHRILAAQTEEEAWNLFGILNCTIVLPYEAYYPLQLKLSRLGRPDAAHLLFRQLRNRAKSAGTRPPGEEMYMMLFHEYALARYEEGIHELETYFRLDLNNEMTVPMLNRMLAAYSALEDGHKVSYLWSEARALPRGGTLGPNDETMCIMLQFFSRNMSLDAVDDLWTSIPSDFRLKLSSGMLKQFVIANCYHGYYSRALDIVKMAPTEYHLPITADLLKDLYNWTLLPARKDEVREYALANFAEDWQKLEQSGELVNILLPAEDETGHTDEVSRRFAAIAELEKTNAVSRA